LEKPKPRIPLSLQTVTRLVGVGCVTGNGTNPHQARKGEIGKRLNLLLLAKYGSTPKGGWWRITEQIHHHIEERGGEERHDTMLMASKSSSK
jgi:hypothetical protein